MRDLPLPNMPLSNLAALAPVRDAREARASRRETRLAVSWACSEEDVREAQALRYQVFAEEMGARLTPQQGAPAASASREISASARVMKAALAFSP